MKTPLLIAYLGNLIDMVSTIYLYGLGYTEINPVMAPLLRFPAVFAVVKLVCHGVCIAHPVAQQGEQGGTLACVAGGGCVWNYQYLLLRVFYILGVTGNTE